MEQWLAIIPYNDTLAIFCTIMLIPSIVGSIGLIVAWTKSIYKKRFEITKPELEFLKNQRKVLNKNLTLMSENYNNQFINNNYSLESIKRDYILDKIIKLNNNFSKAELVDLTLDELFKLRLELLKTTK